MRGSMSGTEEELHWLSITQATCRFAAGTLSPTTLLSAVLRRIEETEPLLNSFVCHMRATAQTAAEASTARWANNTPLSPVDGIPICLKDVFDTAGVVTAAGCHALRERVPEEDAHAVASLRAGGAVILAKSFTVELASGGLINPQYREEITRNPWNITKQPGGSSSGSASAVAGGQCLAGMGTCTGGSIRGPAAYCGVTGFKPTYGLCSKRGVVPLSKTFDHIGILCRSAVECAVMLEVLQGYDPLDPCSVLAPYSDECISMAVIHDTLPLDAVVVVVVPSMLNGCEPAVCANFQAALARLVLSSGLLRASSPRAS